MAILFAPFFRATDQQNAPIAGAFATFYKTGTSTLQPIWSEVTLSIALSNPIQADGNGVFPAIWLDDSLPPYKVVFQYPDVNNPAVPGAIIAGPNGTIDPYNSTFSVIGLGILLNPQTDAERLASVVPTNYNYLAGDVRRYGADPTGVNDSTTAINNALKSNSRVYAIAGLYICSASLVLASGQTFFGDGPATVLQFANGTLNNIVGTTLTNTVVRDLKISVTGTGGVSTTGGIVFKTGCIACKAERVEISGVNWSGVWIEASSKCEVRNCYFHDFTGTTQGSADVIVTDDATATVANYNVIEGNQCFGGGWFGVAVMQYYGAGGVTPSNNLVIGNRISNHVCYGILFYNVTTNADVFNQANGNYIENIQGTVLTGNSGAGIYCAGAGGCSFNGNTIRNACISTSTDTLAPAGIGISGITGLTPFVICGNFIQNIQNFYGIKVTGCNTGGTIVGNTVSLQTGTPRAGIYVINSSNVTVTANNINIATGITGTEGIFIFASGATYGNISVTGNTVVGCSFRGIAIDQTSGAISGFAISGNIVTGGSALSIPLGIVLASNGAVTGNTAIATTVAAMLINTSTGIRIANNYLSSTGTNPFSSAAACTGSYFDKSNIWNGNMNNAGTGLIVEWLGSTVPSVGTWAVGDRTEMSVPVVGQPKGWRCTVAGTPGTWVSEGNL